MLQSLKKIISTIKESLNGEQMDYTQGSIPKAIFLLAIPMILELSLESVFAVVESTRLSLLDQLLCLYYVGLASLPSASVSLQ